MQVRPAELVTDDKLGIGSTFRMGTGQTYGVQGAIGLVYAKCITFELKLKKVFDHNYPYFAM